MGNIIYKGETLRPAGGECSERENQSTSFTNRKNAEALEEAVQKVTELEVALAKCQSQEPKIMKDTIDNSRKTLESVITFRQGKTTIDNSQLPNIERIATYLKNHKEASVVIKGYASPEGSVEVNERLAQQRAEIVKKC